MVPAKPSALLDTKEKRAFEAKTMREDCNTGFFVSFAYRSDAMTEIGQFFKRTDTMIRAFTVCDVLDEELGRKLA